MDQIDLYKAVVHPHEVFANNQSTYLAFSEDFFGDYQVPVAACAVLYVPVVFGLKHIMHNRTPFDLKPLLFIWNVLLCLFSIVCAIHLVPYCLFQFENVGGKTTAYKWMEEFPSHWYVAVFNMSKVFEFFDTILIVLRKKPLIKLHWMHHILTMAYCWYGSIFGHPYATQFACMNVVVHSIMYGYYALNAIGITGVRVAALFITFAQIVQMVGGMYFQVVAYMDKSDPQGQKHPYFFASGIAMYALYFVLFSELFLKRYVFKKKDKAKTN